MNAQQLKELTTDLGFVTVASEMNYLRNSRKRARDAVKYLIHECDPVRNGFYDAFPEFSDMEEGAEPRKETELEICIRQRDWWQARRMEALRQTDRLRERLKQVLGARIDDDGKWIDENGDYIDELN